MDDLQSAMAERSRLEARVRELEQTLAANTQELAILREAVGHCEAQATAAMHALQAGFNNTSVTPGSATHLAAGFGSARAGKNSDFETDIGSEQNTASMTESPLRSTIVDVVPRSESGKTMHRTPQQDGNTQSNVLDPGERPQVLHQRYENVARINGVWAESSCVCCGCNASTHRSKLFRGVAGLHNHVMLAHMDRLSESYEYRDTMLGCAKRVVNLRDVLEMEAGRDPWDVKIGKRNSQTGRKKAQEGIAPGVVANTGNSSETGLTSGIQGHDAVPASTERDAASVTFQDTKRSSGKHEDASCPSAKRQRTKTEPESDDAEFEGC